MPFTARIERVEGTRRYSKFGLNPGSGRLKKCFLEADFCVGNGRLTV